MTDDKTEGREHHKSIPDRMHDAEKNVKERLRAAELAASETADGVHGIESLALAADAAVHPEHVTEEADSVADHPDHHHDERG